MSRMFPIGLFSLVTMLAVSPAFATEQPIEGGEALDTPAIRQSDGPDVTQQGVRPPDPLEEEDAPLLYDLLAQIRRAPPLLDGQVMPRPNAFASEPTTEMPQEHTEPMSLFPEGYIE